MKLKENFNHTRADIKPSVLFARSDSDYKAFDCDVWDMERDAKNYAGSNPVIAHPPCRGWGRLRELAKPLPGEKELALFAIDVVRKNGGVLEHPAYSSLWKFADLPNPGCGMDLFGGWTLPIVQFWFGHRAMKATWLYIVGCGPMDLPDMPLVLGDAPRMIGSPSRRANGYRPRKGDQLWRQDVTDREKDATPIDLALWLLEVARRCAS